MNWLIMMLSVFLASIAQIPLKKSAITTNELSAKYFINIKTAIGYSMMFIASLLSFWSIRKLGIQTAAMIETTGYVYVIIIGRFVFKERFTIRSLLACAFIIGGIIIYAG
jgi:drug/metabolite transporter (DMT)-like permease